VPRPARRDRVLVPDVASSTTRGGLNIVGPFEGSSVESDVARRLASALRAGGIPTSTVSYHRDDRDRGSPWSHSGLPGFPFDANLLVVHPDHMTDFVLDSGPGLFNGRYTIGLWVWDFETPSPSMADAGHMVHEVWTPTSWGSGTASSVLSGPAHCVPIPVGGSPSRVDRASLGLPEGFVFASGVDYEHGFTRQNPLGAVEAYTRAFSQSDGCHLVIDVLHADRYPEEHTRLVGAAEGRPDIVIRQSDHRSASDRNRVLASADCYLSLHRADGGLGTVAKAMCWGTFTVVTATTASLEFQSNQDSGLVRCESKPVPVDEYRCLPGSTWVDPDVEQASSILRSVVDNPDLVAAKVGRARQAASRRFSRSVATAAVRARLADIDARLHCGHGDGRRTERRRQHPGRRG
jgi:hypothetical protein